MATQETTPRHQMDTMEMDDHGDCSDDASDDKVLALDSCACGVSGDPEVPCRVGDQFQVEIPTLITESEYFLYKRNPMDEGNMDEMPSDFLIGLPILIMWIHRKVKNAKRTKLETSCNSKDGSTRKGRSGFENGQGKLPGSKNDDSKLKVKSSDLSEIVNVKRKDSKWLVPGLRSDSWSDSKDGSTRRGNSEFENGQGKLFDSKNDGSKLKVKSSDLSEAVNVKHNDSKCLVPGPHSDSWRDSKDGSTRKARSEFENGQGKLFDSKNDGSKLKVMSFDLSEAVDVKHNDSKCLVPGLHSDLWSDAVKASFLLGMYIFEKEFVKVKRFIESKNMGEILSFYYGTFYRSSEYRRWSEGKKVRSRRCVYGHRMFSGLRLQELLSRLIPKVSDDCQNTLLEVSRTYGDGKMSLEEYVAYLKGAVGMNTLVDAVGIGKGKQDLTGMGIEPSKSNQMIHLRPEIPSGKACSFLTSQEIIKFLTGDYRLSKARSNDLFWEAVWPRLLARGWHSEQPNSYNYAITSKNSLVFLKPGVKKFSRRRLVKGDDYFDSVSDVLHKVASEPELMELENGENEGNIEMKMAEDDFHGRPRHCYLQPRTPSRSTDEMKITIVDTSLSDGKNASKIRELRALPLEISGKLTIKSCSIEDLSEGSSDESDFLSPYRKKNDDDLTWDKSDRVIMLCGKNFREIRDSVTVNGLKPLHVSCKSFKGRESFYEGKSTEVCEADNSRRQKKDTLGNFTRPGKRHRRLTACSQETKRVRTELRRPIPENDSKILPSETPASSENIRSHLGSGRSSSEEPSTGEKPQSPTLIDLNFPQVLPDVGDSASKTRLGEGQNGQTSNNVNMPQMTSDVGGAILIPKSGVGQNGQTTKTLPIGTANSGDQNNANSRRQSTRNRPPTARALEAFANGFLTINSRRKKKEDISKRKLRSRDARRSQVKAGITESGASTAPIVQEDEGATIFDRPDDSLLKEGGNDVCHDGDSTALEKIRIFSNEEETQTGGP